jgi:hypothetical protein
LRNSYGYNYISLVKQSSGVILHTVRAYRKWEIQYVGHQTDT